MNFWPDFWHKIWPDFWPYFCQVFDQGFLAPKHSVQVYRVRSLEAKHEKTKSEKHRTNLEKLYFSSYSFICSLFFFCISLGIIDIFFKNWEHFWHIFGIFWDNSGKFREIQGKSQGNHRTSQEQSRKFKNFSKNQKI